ncbi:F-box domain, Leucine-rich repeat domain, L domain-like protein [Artemisia annua]|uniref:F-box domain, Leucine-rich repeat domain, L domain-like protein n=1 Tax=Artemisia annua TaxID=35608 RepID=A0A2U1Q8N3_ARTAN|nr:F-box domain, Leucine-rich repeat domain, L domain-like protein [Artemisia annua]
MLDTASLCNAAATCLFFNKCARDPLCYADIDLVFPKAKDVVVSELIYRATTALRSIKLCDERLIQIEGSSILTGSFLNSLTFNRAAPGLRRLHLYNIGWKSGNAALLRTLSICQSLIDLEIVCFDRWTLTLESVSKRIPLVERLIFESVGPSQADDYDGDDYDGLEYSTCSEFVLDCPNITTLAPKGFKVPDSMAHELIKGLHKLKYVDFSTSYSFTGSFLENLGSNGGGNNLEVKVTQFMTALLAGDWKSLSHLKIWNYSTGKSLRGSLRHAISSKLQMLPLCLVSDFTEKELVPRDAKGELIVVSNPTIDTLLESLITVATDHASIDDSINRIIDSKSTDSDFTRRVISIGNVLLKAGLRPLRKASDHNAIVWPFCYDVTVKVFAMLDTASVCNAGATCSFFKKCARDPLCYADIDLVTNLVPKANEDVVSTMIYRAGNALRSIKLGVLPYDERLRQIKGSSILTSDCLWYLNINHGAHGLRRLHLYNVRWRDNFALLCSLSDCPSLIDLEIVCFDRWNLTLESVSKRIPLIERLIFESVGPSQADDYDGLKYSTCSKLVLNCPNITTLALKGFKVPDSMAHELIKGLHKLKHVDFSTSYSFTGSFLENLGTNGGGNNLEVKVKHFMAVLVAGDWRSLSHLDVSHTNGLASSKSYNFRRIRTSSFFRKQLLQHRPKFHLVAEFGKSSDECSDEFDLLPSRKITKK